MWTLLWGAPLALANDDHRHPETGAAHQWVDADTLPMDRRGMATFPADAAADASVPDTVTCRARLFLAPDGSVDHTALLGCPDAFAESALAAFDRYAFRTDLPAAVVEVDYVFVRTEIPGQWGTATHPDTGATLPLLHPRTVTVTRDARPYLDDDAVLCRTILFVSPKGKVDGVHVLPGCPKESLVARKAGIWRFTPWEGPDGSRSAFAYEEVFEVDTIGGGGE